MIKKLVVGALVASAISFSTGVSAQTQLPGVDLANGIINDLTAPLRPLLTADASPAPAPAAPAAPPVAKGKHHGRAHHAKSHQAKHHEASRKTKHKAG